MLAVVKLIMLLFFQSNDTGILEKLVRSVLTCHQGAKHVAYVCGKSSSSLPSGHSVDCFLSAAIFYYRKLSVDDARYLPQLKLTE